MSLKQITINKIDQIFNWPLLQHCGEPIEWPETDQIVQVDREQFAESINSDSWENTLRRSFNLISDSIIENRSYRFFADSIRELGKNISDAADDKILKAIAESVFDESPYKEIIERTLVFIVANHCYESEYQEVIHQSNTDRLIKILCAGHLPCGYRGIYPDGCVYAY